MNKITKLSLMTFTVLSTLAACSSDKTAGGTEEADGRFDSANSKTILAWTASTGHEKVVITGSVTSDSAGVWRYVNNVDEGGVAEILWPVPQNTPEDSLFSAVIDSCEGICGTINLKPGTPGNWISAGVGFSLDGADLPFENEVHTTLCVEYSSTMRVHALIDFVDGEQMSATYPPSEQMTEKCKKYGRVSPIKAESFRFVFESRSDTSGTFNISQVHWTIKEEL